MSISLLDEYYNQTAYPPELVGATSVEVYPNGSVHIWQEVYSSDYPWVYPSNESSWSDMGTLFFTTVHQCVDSEGFFSMLPYYCDAGRGPGVPPTHTLTVVGFDYEKSVVFENNAMLGLMPDTYCTMMNSQLEGEITIELEVVEASDLEYEVSCIVDNDGPEELALVGVAFGLWNFDVVRSNGCTFIPRGTAFPTTWTVLEPYTETPMGNHSFDASEMSNGVYSVVAYLESGICTPAHVEFVVDGNDAYVNSPPGDHGMVLKEGSGSGDWVVEISKSYDREDRPEDLLVRWDWDSDGEWDTDWSHDKVVIHAFEDPYDLNLTYEIMDTDGASYIGGDEQSRSGSIKTNWSILIGGMIATCAAVAVIMVYIILPERRKR